MENTSLSKLKLNEEAVIEEINCDKEVKRRILDMGLTKGTTVVLTKFAPLNDPIEILVRDYRLTIRKTEASKIIVRKTNTKGKK